MNAGLRALLTGVIDYAGLFPPAKLPLAQAVRNYLRYRQEPEAWMLGRFICPVERVGELAAFQDEIAADRPMVVSALGRGAETAAGSLEKLRQDDLAVFRFIRRHEARFRVDTLEMRIPNDLVGLPKELQAWVAEVVEGGRTNLFIEIPQLTGQARAALAAIRRVPFPGPILGGKIRCAAPEAGAFPPTSRWIAEVLVASVAEVLPLKATAGLHHPFPRIDEATGARMHGFINLFAAGVLVWCRGLEVSQAEAVLEDDDPASFRFGDDGLRWREQHVSAEEIRQARSAAVLSVGSCSFDEPRDDLRALGWL